MRGNRIYFWIFSPIVMLMIIALIGVISGKPELAAVKAESKTYVQSKPLVTQKKGKVTYCPGKITGKTVLPNLPYVPRGKKPLSGVVVVLDPGHGGSDPGCSWIEEYGWFTKNIKATYFEASYTYRLAWELLESLKAEGAIVYLTAFSQLMTMELNSAQEPYPIPADARYFFDGSGVRSGSAGLEPRVKMARFVWSKWGQRKQVVFISLHIDSMPEGWRGGHICVDRHSSSVPELAKHLARHFRDHGFHRTYKGVEKPLISQRGLYVLNRKRNPIPERVLIELSTPVDQKDSWRIRDQRGRQRLIKDIITSLKDLSN